ncbi:MFS transporter [Proteiniclasticum sp. SCR006]|uniref:MFS transporter n=1 Tax=Proteiniclasticum aestuarii TaxID=2817862 RepID=A0A939HBJ7_9CLOT|nr:MFS transporter [Proteiniclasticum aestuarii]MBO1265330.1 MFS transporter [Proteiniclasticum aestuarii]
MQHENFYTRLDKREKFILNAVFYVFFVNGIFAMVMGSLLPLISREYGLSDTLSGSLISAHSLGNLAAGFVAGVLPLYLGRKRSIVMLSSFVVIGFTLMIVTGSPLLLLVAFLFTGISRGSVSNFNNTMVNEVSDSSPSALSFLHSVFAVGAILAPILVIFSTKIAGDNGWRLSALIIVVLTSFSVFFFSRMEMKEKVAVKEGKKGYEFLKSKVFWVHAGILFFYLAGEATINGWIVKYFVDADIMSIGYAQGLASMLWMAILAGRLTVSFYGDRIKKETLLLVTTTGTVLFYFLLLSTTNVTLITIAIFGIGLSMAGIYPTTVSKVGKTIKDFPMAMGVLLLLGGVGAIVMPILTGALSDAFGIYAGMSAIVVVLIMMMVLVVLSILQGRKAKADAIR